MNITCDLVLKDCLPCNDDPIANISAEAPDVDVFIGFRDFRGNPPLGIIYAQLGCKAICFSETSQQEADECAQRRAQECTWKNWQPPVVPPVPPGPNSPGGKGSVPNTPGGIPPSNPRNRVKTYFNSIQTCDAACPDGSLFTEFVAGGTITELSQALADAKAKSLACNRALANLFCISAATPPASCIGESYFFRLNSSGGLDLQWSIESGSLPPGLTLDSLNGIITGTPISSGSFSFTVSVTDSSGRGQVKDLSICVMEIVTGATLPGATVGDVYAQPLIQEPATVSSEVWSLVSGSLPPGITLAPNGALNGTPTEGGMFEFAIMVAGTCNGSAVTCQKTFNLEVAAVDCMGQAEAVQDLVWTQAGANPFNMVGGDGTAVGVPSGISARATSSLCNPSLDAYDLTFTFDWTAGTDFTSNSQAVVVLNGVSHLSPVETGSGTFQYVVTLSIPSGPNNTLDVRYNQNGVFNLTFNGSLTIRPLVPPPPP